MYYVIFFLGKEAFPFEEDTIYKDPGIVKIYVQDTILKSLDNKMREKLNSFGRLSPQKQEKILKQFSSIQDLLEQEYMCRKTRLANQRLLKYGLSTLLSTAFPLGLLWGYNSFLVDDDKLSVGALPFVCLQASNYFFFKFLEIFTQKYIASSDGAIQEYEIRYVRNKPFFEEDFCKVFEGKLIAAHKTKENLYDYIKWFNSALALPISKRVIPFKQLSKRFEEEFSIYPQETRNKVKELALQHIIHKQSRTIAHFWGPSGAGKTECVHRLARLLGVPYGLIVLSSFSVSDLIGQGGTHRSFPGKLAEAILNAKGLDNKSGKMILFFDEVDKILTGEDGVEDIEGIESFLLNFLDPKTEYYYSPYFEKNIYIKDMLIILGSIDKLANSALRKRVIKIPFTGFEKDIKQRYIFDQYLPKLYEEIEVYGEDGKCYKLSIKEHFSEEDKKGISQQILKDEDPGLRGIQEEINQFVINKLIKVYVDSGILERKIQEKK